MTHAQQQYVQRLSAIEAARVRADLIKRKEFERANRFWDAWEQLHPIDKPVQDSAKIAQAAWSGQGFAQRSMDVKNEQWVVDREKPHQEAPVSSYEVKQAICSQLSERA